MDLLTPAMKTLNSILCLTVHDEVVIDTKHPELIEPKVREIMERPIPQLGGISIPVDIQVGRNWATKTKDNPDGMVPYKEWEAKYAKTGRRKRV